MLSKTLKNSLDSLLTRTFSVLGLTLVCFLMAFEEFLHFFEVGEKVPRKGSGEGIGEGLEVGSLFEGLLVDWSGEWLLGLGMKWLGAGDLRFSIIGDRFRVLCGGLLGR